MFVYIAVNVLNCHVVQSEFKLQSSSFTHFKTKTFGKGTNPLILIAIG